MKHRRTKEVALQKKLVKINKIVKIPKKIIKNY